jgi:YD repeat-containing protein
LFLSGGSPIYEGQVTRTTYPDGTTEYAGYYAPPDANGHRYYLPDDPTANRDDGALHWTRERDGRLTLLSLDPQGRVVEVRRLKVDGTTAQLVDVAYDEFGRLTQRTDHLGATQYQYDSLNRLASASFTPMGQGTPTKSWAYSYVKDYARQRRITTETVMTGVGREMIPLTALIHRIWMRLKFL